MIQESALENLFDGRVLHRHCRFETGGLPGESQLTDNTSRNVDGRQALLPLRRGHRKLDPSAFNQINSRVLLSG